MFLLANSKIPPTQTDLHFVYIFYADIAIYLHIYIGNEPQKRSMLPFVWSRDDWRCQHKRHEQKSDVNSHSESHRNVRSRRKSRRCWSIRRMTMMTVWWLHTKRMTRDTFVCCGSLAPTISPSSCLVVLRFHFIRDCALSFRFGNETAVVFARASVHRNFECSTPHSARTHKRSPRTRIRWISIWWIRFFVLCFLFISIVWFSGGGPIRLCVENDSADCERSLRHDFANLKTRAEFEMAFLHSIFGFLSHPTRFKYYIFLVLCGRYFVVWLFIAGSIL